MAAPPSAARMQKEIVLLERDPPPGVSAWPVNGRLDHLEAEVAGPSGTVYERGAFRLEVLIPERYPFEPPKVRFITPVYHPNIDSGGRICLDTLNMPPKGVWKPSLNIPTVLASIGLLLAEPNPDDGLMTEITEEYKRNRAVFDMKARQQTQKHAIHMHKEEAVGASAETGGDGGAGEGAAGAAATEKTEDGGGSPGGRGLGAEEGTGAGAGAGAGGGTGDEDEDDVPLSDSSDDESGDEGAAGGAGAGGGAVRAEEEEELVEDTDDEETLSMTQAALSAKSKRRRLGR